MHLWFAANVRKAIKTKTSTLSSQTISLWDARFSTRIRKIIRRHLPRFQSHTAQNWRMRVRQNCESSERSRWPARQHTVHRSFTSAQNTIKRGPTQQSIQQLRVSNWHSHRMLLHGWWFVLHKWYTTSEGIRDSLQYTHHFWLMLLLLHRKK